MDVVRVLSAILLLGNVEFAPRLGDDSFDVEVFGKEELTTVARLLGISSTLLWQGITTRTHTIKGQPMKSMSDANMVSVKLSSCLILQIKKAEKFSAKLCNGQL